MGLKPRVKIVCPECDEPLSFTCLDRRENEVSWVLSTVSRKHLAEAHASALRVLTAVKCEHVSYLAA